MSTSTRKCSSISPRCTTRSRPRPRCRAAGCLTPQADTYRATLAEGGDRSGIELPLACWLAEWPYHFGRRFDRDRCVETYLNARRRQVDRFLVGQATVRHTPATPRSSTRCPADRLMTMRQLVPSLGRRTGCGGGSAHPGLVGRRSRSEPGHGALASSGLAAAIGIGVAAGLYPSLRAARLSPTEALRTV